MTINCKWKCRIASLLSENLRTLLDFKHHPHRAFFSTAELWPSTLHSRFSTVSPRTRTRLGANAYLHTHDDSNTDEMHCRDKSSKWNVAIRTTGKAPVISPSIPSKSVQQLIDQKRAQSINRNMWFRTLLMLSQCSQIEIKLIFEATGFQVEFVKWQVK